MSSTTFLQPHFENRFEALPVWAPGKIHKDIEILSDHSFAKSSSLNNAFVIGNTGFSSHRDGTYVFATRFQHRADVCGYSSIGFTSTGEHNRNTQNWPSQPGMNGVALTCATGNVWSGSGDPHFFNRSISVNTTKHFDEKITSQAKEVVSILTIARELFTVQFIVDGNEGPTTELDKSIFVNAYGGDEIFPVVTVWAPFDQFEFVAFDKLTFFSSKIEELMMEYRSNESAKNGTTTTASNLLKKKPSAKKVGVVSVVKPTSKQKQQQTKKKPSAKKIPKKATKPPKPAAKKAGKKVSNKPEAKKAKKNRK